MAINDPYKQYQMNAIETASPLMLIIMLYDEAIKCLKYAKIDMLNKNKEGQNAKLIKVQKILTELTVSLNMEAGGTIAQNLKALYTYMHSSLVDANINNKPEKIDEIHHLLVELRSSWHKVSMEQRKGLIKGQVIAKNEEKVKA